MNNQPDLSWLPYTCKAANWEEVKSIWPSADPADLELPEANILGRTPCARFTAPAPAQYFLAHNTFGTFLINTEGYSYARYALKIREVRP